MTRYSPFKLILFLFAGLAFSLLFGILSAAIIYLSESADAAREFMFAYTTSFKTVVSFGLILGTALIIGLTQTEIPETIERVFENDQLKSTHYRYYKRRYGSVGVTLRFTGTFLVVAFVIFSICGFPLSGFGEKAMMVAACAQYALGVYVGRKLIYQGMMIHSLLSIEVTRNYFEHRELNDINNYVHWASTLTIIFVYVNVVGYFGGPFKYDTWLGDSVKPFLLIPIVIATPVLLVFNFFPRAVLREVYSKSIDVQLRKLKIEFQNEDLTEFEKRSYMIEFNKMSRDELRYNLQLSLSDLPIGITILIMVMEPLLRR